MNPRLAHAWMPWLVAGCFGLLLILPPTRAWAYQLQLEDGPIEWATAVLLALAGLIAILAAARAGSGRERVLLGGAALAFLLVCGEELAWGQHILGHPLWEGWAAINRQQETTLHNLDGMQGKAELLYLLPALAGLAAIRLAGLRRWLGAAAVSADLAPGLLLVSLYSVAAIANAVLLRDRNSELHSFFAPMSEMIELIIAWLALRWSVQARAATRA